ncbi:MAG: hypothetical protein Q7S40_13955 [Opitutaceae bacterium]|nr:hypothetical protein [Opitutaceae bacterium]
MKIAFGGAFAAVFDVGVPILDGHEVDDLFPTAKPAGRAGSFTLFKMGNWHLGIAAVAVAPGLEQAANQVYREIFKVTGGVQVARIWNYVPAINGTGANGRENYQAFCEGRSRAFEERHGRDFKLFVPAASAVGCNSAFLTVAFAACATKPRHVENPLQVPAYDYPRKFGPRSPSFARATIARDGDVATVFISGTAAIRGHATVGACGIAGQLECTLQNLAEISRACGLGSRLDQGGRSSRHFRVYVRHAADQPLVAATLGEHLFSNGDRISYLHADICRQPLLVEIEATLLGVTVPSRPN